MEIDDRVDNDGNNDKDDDEKDSIVVITRKKNYWQMNEYCFFYNKS